LNQASSVAAFVTGLTPYLPLALTIVGWVVLSGQQDKRERRKEIRELVRMIESRVDSILELTTEYYGLPGDDPKCASFEQRIFQNFNAIRSIRGRMTSAGFRCNVDAEYVKFHQAATGGSFQSRSRKPDGENVEVIGLVAACGFKLVGKIDRAYFDKFSVSVT
jgi:hypothetical protein